MAFWRCRGGRGLGCLPPYPLFQRSVLSPRSASNATRALNSAVNRRHSLCYARLALERLIFDQLEAAIDPNAVQSFRGIVQGARRDYGQRFFWKLGKTAPERGRI